jgi:lipoic acid synthetase
VLSAKSTSPEFAPLKREGKVFQDGSSPQRKPEWLRKSRKSSAGQTEVEGLLKELGLNTVCKEARCPNYSECFAKKTATFMIMGTRCTRNCKFCNVTSARPLPLDADEPVRVALATKRLGLKYLVLTSVTRDDLEDGGAAHFARSIEEIRGKSPKTRIEVLVPDFQGSSDALKIVTDAAPDVISHNVETVPELYSKARKQANYQRSLKLLGRVKELNPNIRTKSGLMLGLGESESQIKQVFHDLRAQDCDFLSIGQYLAPTINHLPVASFITPDEFDYYGELARTYGFSYVASAPLVRSSFQAEEAFTNQE